MTIVGNVIDRQPEFQSTCPLRGHDHDALDRSRDGFASIHAPLAGRDVRDNSRARRRAGVSIHAPLAGRDTDPSLPVWAQLQFQSTRPLRGATDRVGFRHGAHPVSIHAPLAGRDVSNGTGVAAVDGFNPRAPCGARREAGKQGGRPESVSIHAPLAGRDRCGSTITIWIKTVSIHAPLAGRDGRQVAQVADQRLFQSTRPLRGATQSNYDAFMAEVFQSTRPLRGATRFVCDACQDITFQSTRPLRGATILGLQRSTRSAFQSTRPLRGATLEYAAAVQYGIVSIHAPLAGRVD